MSQARTPVTTATPSSRRPANSTSHSQDMSRPSAYSSLIATMRVSGPVSASARAAQALSWLCTPRIVIETRRRTPRTWSVTSCPCSFSSRTVGCDGLIGPGTASPGRAAVGWLVRAVWSSSSDRKTERSAGPMPKEAVRAESVSRKSGETRRGSSWLITTTPVVA